MAKKKGKQRAKAAVKKSKKSKSNRHRASPLKSDALQLVSAPAAEKAETSEVNSEIDKLLKSEGNLKQELENLEEKETTLEHGEEQLKKNEARIEKEEKKILGLEEDIKGKVTIKPLGKVTIRDVNKGLIGAFFGTIAHFAFIYGREIAKGITNNRAAVLYIFSYFLLIFLMYRAGYREIDEKRYLELFPLRATILYLLSICVVIFVFLLYNQIEVVTLGILFREVSVVSILAVLGAGTADMIGRD